MTDAGAMQRAHAANIGDHICIESKFARLLLSGVFTN